MRATQDVSSRDVVLPSPCLNFFFLSVVARNHYMSKSVGHAIPGFHLVNLPDDIGAEVVSIYIHQNILV